jgi:hypothetical protein
MAPTGESAAKTPKKTKGPAQRRAFRTLYATPLGNISREGHQAPKSK